MLEFGGLHALHVLLEMMCSEVCGGSQAAVTNTSLTVWSELGHDPPHGCQLVVRHEAFVEQITAPYLGNIVRL